MFLQFSHEYETEWSWSADKSVMVMSMPNLKCGKFDLVIKTSRR